MSDAALGKMLLIISCLSFCYYTAWVIMLPFSDPDQAIPTCSLCTVSAQFHGSGFYWYFGCVHSVPQILMNELVICFSEQTQATKKNLPVREL
jgi:hypothetical protein